MPVYDAIIGTGQAGPSLAKRLAGAGQHVAIIEREAFGGTCINTGCTPTKDPGRQCLRRAHGTSPPPSSASWSAVVCRWTCDG